MPSKLSPIQQEWFDENRERFDADSHVLPTAYKRCTHYLIRNTGSDIGCKNCTAHWIDSRLVIEDGKIVGG